VRRVLGVVPLCSSNSGRPCWGRAFCIIVAVGGGGVGSFGVCGERSYPTVLPRLTIGARGGGCTFLIGQYIVLDAEYGGDGAQWGKNFLLRVN